MPAPPNSPAPAPPAVDASLRRRELAKIHCARRDLGLAEADYRDLLQRLTGARSAARLDSPQRRQVLDHFAAAGWRPRKRPDRQRPHNLDARPMLGKIEALLAAQRLPWAYAASILARLRPEAGPLAMASDAALRGVIAALDAQRRRQARDRVHCK